MVSELDLRIPVLLSLHDRRVELKRHLRDAVEIAVAGRKLSSANVYELFLHCHGPWYRPDGRPLRRDTDNIEKVTKDALFAALGLDDAHEFRCVRDKRVDEDCYVRVILRPLRGLGPEGC